MYLFLVRHFNDIDHLTPVVWKLKKDNYPVAVYCMNPGYDISQDYRLEFLKNQGIPVDYVNMAIDQNRSVLHDILQFFMQWCVRGQKRTDAGEPKHNSTVQQLYGRIIQFLGSFSYKIARKIFYDHRWAETILRKTEARAVCFDHVMPRLYVVDAFLTAAQNMGIPTLAMPHGVHLYTNENTKPKATDSRRFQKFNRFDHVIVPNQLRKDFLTRAGISDEKISVLGSARYCREWMEQNNRIVPRMIEPERDGHKKLKVVFMPSKPQCNVHLERLAATCLVLDDLAEIKTMIKPHTRTGIAANLYQDLRVPIVPHMLTAELCDWADVILVIGSSVISEAIVRDKPALYLKYLHDNTTLFEEIGSCWTIHGEAELRDALIFLQSNRSEVPYDEADIAQYITEVVKGGKSDRDVLQDYEQFIVSHSKSDTGSERL
jgi:hypothetical protein